MATHFSVLAWRIPGRAVQARILEWVAFPFSKASSQPRDQTCISCGLLHWQADSLPLAPPGKPIQRTAAAAAKALQSCPTLCDPRDDSPPGSPIPGIFQARTLEWVAISFSNAWKVKSQSEVAQLYPTLCDPIDSSLPGSSIHGIFQARVLEWVAILHPQLLVTTIHRSWRWSLEWSRFGRPNIGEKKQNRTLKNKVGSLKS